MSLPFMSRNIFDIIDDFLSQVKVFMLNDKKYVLKKYTSEQGIIKWFLIKAAGTTAKVYPYTMDPDKRMLRETFFMENIGKAINTPKIIVKDWIGKTIIREYIEGEIFKPSDDTKPYYVIGTILARIHEKGFVLGDTKFYNFLIKNNKYYLIDGEQAIKSNDPSYRYWDLMVFNITIIYGLINRYLGKSLKIVNNVVKAFFEGYIDYGGDFYENTLLMYNKFNYRTLAYLLLPLPYNIYYIKVIESLI